MPRHSVDVMIIDRYKSEAPHDVESYAWKGIDRFKNTAFVTDLICDLHQVPTEHTANARKQATQIRQCLTQASEYFSAAKSVSPATQPVLLYYGTMSLALAEVLLKGSGKMSLDAARGKNAHHGLVLKVDGKPSNAETLESAASNLRALPMSAQGKRSGTFHLWWQLSREGPVCGRHRTEYGTHGENSTQILLAPSDTCFAPIPEHGISLLKCFKNTPYLFQELADNGIGSELVPSRFERWHNKNTGYMGLKNYINPSDPNALSNAANKIMFHPSAMEELSLTELHNGYIIEIVCHTESTQSNFSYPNSFQWHVDNVFLCSDNNMLNEFGVYYTGCYILGNYARYFPDQWMSDIENSTPLSLISMHFLDALRTRVPLLAYSELSRAWMLMKS